MINICLLKQLKAQLLSSHLPQVRTHSSDSSCEHNREIAVLSKCYHCSRQQLGLKSQPPIKSVSCTMTWPSMKNAMDASYAFISFSYDTDIARSFRLIVQLHRLNPHWEMDKTFSPSYSPSQKTYVEVEAVRFSRFRFHRKRTASTSLPKTAIF